MKHEKPYKFRPGDAVRVIDGVMEPDTQAFSLGGWQGRVVDADYAESDDETSYIELEWDSVSLQTMPDSFIEDSENEGLDWRVIVLTPEELELATERDSVEETLAAQKNLEWRFAYSYLGEEGKRIAEILHGIDPDDYGMIARRWEKYFRQHLTFPFEAIVDEPQKHQGLKIGDRVKVTAITFSSGECGVIVEVQLGKKRFDCMLCDLQPINNEVPGSQSILDYRSWFANR